MLKFIGRLGEESYKKEGPDGKPELDASGKEIFLKRPQQQFKSGVMVVKENTQGTTTVYEDVLDKDGKQQFDDKGGKLVKPVQKPCIIVKTYTFKVADIGKSFEFADENDVLKRYPNTFQKG